MMTLLRYFMPIMLLASCAHSYDEEPNFHAWNYEYDLVSMQRHEGALQRDKEIMDSSGIEKTTATMVSYWNGDIEWVELNICDCVRVTRLMTLLRRCIGARSFLTSPRVIIF